MSRLTPLLYNITNLLNKLSNIYERKKKINFYTNLVSSRYYANHSRAFIDLLKVTLRDSFAIVLLIMCIIVYFATKCA